MVLWPCMLKLAGDDELFYLSSFDDFTLVCSELMLNDDDYAIDSTGSCYCIIMAGANLKLIANGSCLTVPEVTELIRAHEFNKASTCLTKIHFLTVTEAINSLVN